MPILTLLTDFGGSDGYVGAMKGVILSICPTAILVDISHEVARHDVIGGALVLWGAYRYFPAGTVHCAVVDPGVGTERKAIAVQTSRYIFVGPDNGLLSWAVAEDGLACAVEIANPTYRLPQVSRTFHGRDIFAPAAAHLAKGAPLSEVGPELSDIHHLPTLRAKVKQDRIKAEVVYIDHFGNAITNLSESEFESWQGGHHWLAQCRGHKFERVSESYAAVPEGKPLLIFNSFGLLEIAINGGSAHDLLRVERGDMVEIEKVT